MPKRIRNRKVPPFLFSIISNRKVRSQKIERSVWIPFLYALLIIGVTTPREPNKSILLKSVMKHFLYILWNLILAASLILNVYESATTLHKYHIMLLCDTLLLILMKYVVQSKLRIVVKNFEKMNRYLLSAHLNSFGKKDFRKWVWTWSFLVLILGVASFVKMWLITDIIDAVIEGVAWNDFSVHIKKWPLLIKTANFLFRMVIAFRTALANYASTVTALLFCLTFKLERQIVQWQNLRIEKMIKKGLSNETFADLTQEIHRTTSLLQSVNESLSSVIFILICYWMSSIFFCLTNILDGDQLYQSGPQTQLFVSCVIIIFYVMFSYLAHLASKIKQEYYDLEILVAMESELESFGKESFAANFELVGRIHDKLGLKLVITPLELFTLDAKLIHTILGVIITYGVIISQSLGK